MHLAEKMVSFYFSTFS